MSGVSVGSHDPDVTDPFILIELLACAQKKRQSETRLCPFCAFCEENGDCVASVTQRTGPCVKFNPRISDLERFPLFVGEKLCKMVVEDGKRRRTG